MHVTQIFMVSTIQLINVVRLFNSKYLAIKILFFISLQTLQFTISCIVHLTASYINHYYNLEMNAHDILEGI